MNYIILGAPASGKGTQAELLSKKLNIPHIASGIILRENINNKTELGLKVEAILNRGDLVSDDIVIDLIKNRLEQGDCKDGYILDGFPRTIAQAEALDGITKIDKVIDIVVNDDVAVSRITNRRMCKSCGNPYHLEFNPSKLEGVCDKCNGELYLREDDKEEVVKDRLKVYHDQTEPLKEYYKEKIITIDGIPSIKQVTESIFKNLQI
ncbi:adenylate kinase [bacterium]|jgi:adenylate kinase|nr:adenylate kinase [bacterium]MBT4121618.1 adenylate kinase [bacterium]MBT4495280.1 adenylate kinase [bacterium]MBT4763904.1 adenylate kinase [bacterium]MBT5401275.1 adenylate kinase [bacterium]